MRFAIAFAQEHLELQIDDSRVVGLHRAPAALPDPAATLRSALEAPFHFPALRRALTPADHIAVVVDEHLPDLGRLLVPVLEHLTSAGIQPEAITLVCPPATQQPWLEDLPDAFQEVQVEVHDPKNRQHLSYVATTAAGRRLYLNRSVADADQVVVVGRRRYDPLLGHAGAAGDLFPALSDELTRTALHRQLTFTAPQADPWPLRQEAEEVSWLLGTPFFVQFIDAAADGLAHVVTGVAEASQEGQRLLNACWRQTVPEPADLVVASIRGAPARHPFADLAAAVACAARVVVPDGRILLLSRGSPEIGPGREILMGFEDPQQALQRLQREPSVELIPALQWAGAAAHARISLLSDYPDDTVEDLFASALPDAGGVQRWLDRGGSCLFLEDAHKTLAVLE